MACWEQAVGLCAHVTVRDGAKNDKNLSASPAGSGRVHIRFPRGVGSGAL